MINQEFISKVIMALGQCRTAGFGYVETLMDVFYSHRTALSIGVSGVVWNLHYQGKSFEYSFFYNNQKISLDSFNKQKLMAHQGVLNSALDDFSEFKYSKEFELAHTVIIPIHYQKCGEHLFDIGGFIILISTTRINLSKDDFDIIYSLLSCKRPSTIDNQQVSKAINVLVSDNLRINELSLKHRHKTLNKALEIMAAKNDVVLNQHGLRHFSFWSIDKVGRIYASKEFNKNTYSDIPHSITTDCVSENLHYIYEYAKYLQEYENKDDVSLIRIIEYSEFESSLTNKEYFKSIGIVEEESALLLVPIRFESYTSVCCFYVRDIIYSPFVSLTFMQELADAIKQRITLVNEINIKNMLSMMMDRPSIIKDHKGYYKEVVNILKDGNEAEDCLVYLINEQNTRFLLVAEEDENNLSTTRDFNVESGSVRFYLPEKYRQDIDFVDYLKSVLWDKKTEFLYEKKDGKSVKTACLTLINDVNGHYYGFVLLFNKKHATTSSGTYFHNTFYYNNIYIIKACSRYLVLYRNLEFANNRRNTLLIKYRHEMPHCTSAIEQNIRKIKEEYKDPVFRIHSLENLANDLLVNCDRIDMLASFFSAVDYDDQRLLSNPHPFRMEDFVNAKIDTFREEGSTRGVFVKADIDLDTPTLNVSIFFQLSVQNLIINAIRYASPGTTILVRSNSDMIEVVDMGIEVKESDRENIFIQGFRGAEARKIDQKGMGYGLSLTKRIVDAHNYSIDFNSEFAYERNYFAESALYYGLGKMGQDKSRSFIYHEAINAEFNQANLEFFRIQNSIQNIYLDDRIFLNRDEYSINTWMDYTKAHGPFFLDMEEDIFSKPVYKVSFIIRLR